MGYVRKVGQNLKKGGIHKIGGLKTVCQVWTFEFGCLDISNGPPHTFIYRHKKINLKAVISFKRKKSPSWNGPD